MHSLIPQMRLQAVEALLARNEYIKKNFPALCSLSLKTLWFFCIYQGQLALRQIEPTKSHDTILYLKNILIQHPWLCVNCTFKERLWLTLARCSFYGTCRLRNALKIGL